MPGHVCAEGVREWLGLKLRVLDEKSGDDVLVLEAAERAGRIDESSAWSNVLAELMQQRALPLGCCPNLARREDPFQMRRASPRA